MNNGEQCGTILLAVIVAKLTTNNKISERNGIHPRSYARTFIQIKTP